MTFDEWKTAVGQSLRANNRGFAVKQIAPDILDQAYQSGQSPVLFAQRDDIAPAPKPSRKLTLSNAGAWIVCAGVIAIAGALTFRVVSGTLTAGKWERALGAVKSFPVDLPLASGGMPPKASDGATYVEEMVREELIAPKSGVFSNVVATKLLGRNRYQFDGKVEAKNQFGTAVVDAFSATVSHLYAGTPRESWKLEMFTPTGEKDLGIWRSQGVFRGVKEVPPKFPPFQRRMPPNMYREGR